MAEVLLFHHAQGLTPGVRAFADELRAAGHTVHTPDLFDGRTFASIDEGMAYVKEHRLRRRSSSAACARADDLPTELVYAGLLVRRDDRPEAGPDAAGRARRAALLLVHPDQRRVGVRTLADGVPVQIHGMDADPIFVGEGDVDAAREIVDERSRTPSSSSIPATSTTSPTARCRRTTPEATALLTQRVLAFLDRV